MSETDLMLAVQARLQMYEGFQGHPELVSVNDYSVLRQSLELFPCALITSNLSFTAAPLMGQKIQAAWSCQVWCYAEYRDETAVNTQLQLLIDDLIVLLLQHPGLELSLPRHGTMVVQSIDGIGSFDDVFMQTGDELPVLRGRGFSVSAKELISLLS